MGNINLYKSTTGKAPWSLVKENIQSPVTITESTGGSLYYAVRDEGDGGLEEPSDYKIISSPVYVYKTTDKISSITFDDTTNANALIIKVTSTCSVTTNQKVKVQINPNNKGWRNLGDVAIGTNQTINYTPTTADALANNSQVLVRGYIYNTTNTNYKSNTSSQFTYTLSFTNTAPVIDRTAPKDSNGFGFDTIDAACEIFDSTGNISYGKGTAARIPIAFDMFYTLCTIVGNQSLTYTYGKTKIGLKIRNTATFSVPNPWYNTIRPMSDNKILLPWTASFDGETDGVYVPLSDTTGKTHTLKMAGYTFKCLAGIIRVDPCSDDTTIVFGALLASSGNKNNDALAAINTYFVGPYGACGMSMALIDKRPFSIKNTRIIQPLYEKANANIFVYVEQIADVSRSDYCNAFILA